jgi:cytochrome c oxidase subunit 2
MTDTRTDATPPGPPDGPESMGIDPFEKNWIRLAILLIAVFFVTITAAGFALGFQVPGNEARVDPRTVATEGPFANPGVREIVPDREYEVYMISQMWSFNPREITVPVGAKVTFYVTSVDIQHGLKLQDTNINMQVVPGEVSKLSTTFETVGEFPYICTEYCGTGHAAMFGSLFVVEEMADESEGAGA